MRVCLTSPKKAFNSTRLSPPLAKKKEEKEKKDTYVSKVSKSHAQSTLQSSVSTSRPSDDKRSSPGSPTGPPGSPTFSDRLPKKKQQVRSAPGWILSTTTTPAFWEWRSSGTGSGVEGNRSRRSWRGGS